MLLLGMWKRSILRPLPQLPLPLPLPFCSSNTSSYPTHHTPSCYSRALNTEFFQVATRPYLSLSSSHPGVGEQFVSRSDLSSSFGADRFPHHSISEPNVGAGSQRHFHRRPIMSTLRSPGTQFQEDQHLYQRLSPSLHLPSVLEEQRRYTGC